MATPMQELANSLDEVKPLIDVIADLESQISDLEVKRNEAQEQLAERLGPLTALLPKQTPTLSRPRRTSSTATRERLSPEERIAQVVEFVQANPGTNNTLIAEGIGVSTATVTKAVDSALKEGTIRSEGTRRARKLYPKG